MRLKELAIKGFKSFADETVIHFNENITGIVGPNGSGKSNIVDAIRWVLGEQKGRELRLEQMSDVIFNGTKKRREAPVAQVSLLFENTKNLLPTEYNNVEIERLLYRSGDSEYRLNGVNCRLKDITGLFLDTGIGSDSYAIIALNMVEDLLSNKESARRKMFEQAAGISKYKVRKRESLNKLKATREDLARIEDLLFEINNNLTELEKQARRTKRYNELREKYRAAGLLVQYLTARSLQQQMASIESQIQTELLLVGQEEGAIRQVEASIEANKKAHLDQERNLSDFQRRVNEILDEIRTLESSIQIKEQQSGMQHSQQMVLQQNIAQLEQKLENFSRDLIQLTSELEACTQDLHQAEAFLQLQESQFLSQQEEYNRIKTGVDLFQQEKQQLEASLHAQEKTAAIAENQMENLRLDSIRCDDEIRSRSGELERIEASDAEMSVMIGESEAILQDLFNKEEERQNALKAVQIELEKCASDVAAVNRQKDAKTNAYDLLKSMVDKLEGFPESVKFLHHNWRKDIPILSDLIYTEEKYRAAIELYLENYLNYYVANTEEEAIAAIRLLFNNAKGKANFFILDKFRQNAGGNRQIPGCLPALSLIEVSDKYRPLFAALLENVYLFEAEQHLEDISRFPDDISVISLSGSILKANRMIVGGSVGLFEGKKLGRKKNLEKLEAEITKLDSEAAEMNRKLAELRDQQKSLELEDRGKHVEEARRQLAELTLQAAQTQAKRQHLQRQEEELRERIRQNGVLLAEQSDRLAQSRNEMAGLEEKLSLLSGNLVGSDDEFNRASASLSDAANSFNQAKIELLRWQNRFENCERDLNAKRSMIAEAGQAMQVERTRVEELRLSIEQLGVEVQQERENLRIKLENRKEMEQDLSELERSYYEMRNEISELEAKVKMHQRNLSELQSKVNSIKDQKAEWKYRLQTAHEKARIEFHAELETLMVSEEEAEEADLDQLQEKAQYYKSRIDNYGEVNPLALEAYEEMKARLDKITEQKEDIIRAQDSLLETIQEIESTATASFMQAFNQVRVHFQAVFRSLFTDDDDCDLVLVDEADPLECDIDIIAKPKGKRPKSISQLSGGEKTLTAIALLFSLYLLKPAPFCIFDEVDAPLDDINIEKFNLIVRKFSGDSQFILITHNKLTMADVDVLYGVYMEEPGISSVTAVDFRKFSHEIELEEMEN
jgi:chromosome segregation protein